MAKLNMNVEQISIFKRAQTLLEKIEEALEETEFELVLEGENMFIRTMDEKHVFRIVDKSMGSDAGLRDSVLLLPRTNDAQDLIPVLLDGKEPEWKR